MPKIVCNDVQMRPFAEPPGKLFMCLLCGDLMLPKRECAEAHVCAVVVGWVEELARRVTRKESR
jgi:hypothetical protein